MYISPSRRRRTGDAPETQTHPAQVLSIQEVAPGDAGDAKIRAVSLCEVRRYIAGGAGASGRAKGQGHGFPVSRTFALPRGHCDGWAFFSVPSALSVRTGW